MHSTPIRSFIIASFAARSTLRTTGTRCGRGMAARLCLGLLASSLAAAEQPPRPALTEIRSWSFADADRSVSQAAPFAYGLRIEMAIVTGTRWAPDVIMEAARRAASILAQCEIRVTLVRLHEFDGPERYRYLSTPDSREFAQRAALAKPAVFFVDDTRQHPAFDAEAIGRGNATTRPEMADTVWITVGTRDLPIALAHELVHVLSDSGSHSTAPDNLMRDETAPGNTKLTSGQCSSIVRVGKANGLLVGDTDGTRQR